MVAGGDALARADDGRVVLVDGALPGERVRIEVTANRADHLRGRVVEILDASPARVDAAVRPRPRGLRRLRVAARRDRTRNPNSSSTSSATRSTASGGSTTRRWPSRSCSRPTGFRTTVRALVVDGKPAFRRHQSHDPVAVDSCLVAHPLIDELLRDGQFGRRDRGDVAGRARHRRTGRARRSRGDDPRPAARRDAREVGPRARGHRRSHDARVDQLVLPEPDRRRGHARPARARGDRTRSRRRRPLLRRRAVRGDGRHASPRRRRRAGPLGRRRREAQPEGPRRRAIVRADVGKWQGNKVDVVVADPSRAGLGKDGARTVLACDADRVVLVSCDAAALARDVGAPGRGRLHAHVGDARRPVRAHAAHRVRDVLDR